MDTNLRCIVGRYFDVRLVGKRVAVKVDVVDCFGVLIENGMEDVEDAEDAEDVEDSKPAAVVSNAEEDGKDVWEGLSGRNKTGVLRDRIRNVPCFMFENVIIFANFFFWIGRALSCWNNLSFKYGCRSFTSDIV
jgi:hypothetical protein